MSIGIYVRIKDEKIWLQFKEYVLAKHGKLHSALGAELVEALKQYLQNKSCTHTQIQQISPKFEKELPLIEKAILTHVEKGGSLPESMLANIIRRTIQKIDHRTIKSRIEALVSVGFLKRDWDVSPDGKVYRVVGDGADNFR